MKVILLSLWSIVCSLILGTIYGFLQYYAVIDGRIGLIFIPILILLYTLPGVFLGYSIQQLAVKKNINLSFVTMAFIILVTSIICTYIAIVTRVFIYLNYQEFFINPFDLYSILIIISELFNPWVLEVFLLLELVLTIFFTTLIAKDLYIENIYCPDCDSWIRPTFTKYPFKKEKDIDSFVSNIKKGEYSSLNNLKRKSSELAELVNIEYMSIRVHRCRTCKKNIYLTISLNRKKGRKKEIIEKLAVTEDVYNILKRK